jgi:hypothetical protein
MPALAGVTKQERLRPLGRKTRMRVYSVHEPPVRTLDPLPDAERFVFVRDGFSFRAFLFAPLWMLWHRMWWVLAGYLIVSALLETTLVVLGATPAGVFVVGLLISLLVGLEASTLRRFTLNRRGWRNVGIISGATLEDAERRFFEAWLQAMSHPAAVATAAAAPTPGAASAAPPHTPQEPNVVGLFPEPGAH